MLSKCAIVGSGASVVAPPPLSGGAAASADSVTALVGFKGAGGVGKSVLAQSG